MHPAANHIDRQAPSPHPEGELARVAKDGETMLRGSSKLTMRAQHEENISTAHTVVKRYPSPAVDPAEGSGRWFPTSVGMDGVGLGYYLALAGWMCLWVLANMGCSLLSRYKTLPVLEPRRDHVSEWQAAKQARRERKDNQICKLWMYGRFQHRTLTIFPICRALFFGLDFTARIIHTRPWRVFRLDGLRRSLPPWAAPSPYPTIQLE